MKKLKRLHAILTVHIPMLAKVELLRLFPGLYGIVKIRPDSAWLNPTDNCNMRCIMCNQWRETKTNELTTAEWKHVIDQLADAGIKKVGFNGGEPLLRKDLAEIFAHVTARGMAPALITSGYLLDEARLEALLKAGMAHATISIDGSGAEYEAIRGREWPRVEKAVELLAKAYRDGRVDANVGFVVMKQTLDHLPGVRAVCERVGLPLTFSLVDSTPFFFKLPQNDRSAADTNWVGPEDRPKLRALQQILLDMKARAQGAVIGTYANIAYIADYFRDPLQASTPCTVSQVRVMINSRGEVYGGCWSMGARGSLREKSLREVLDSPEYVKAHREMFYKDCPGCSCGYGTNVRYDLRKTLKNFVWRALPPLRASVLEDAAPVAAEKAPVKEPSLP
jgi:MoaA/NifB/PqqE/SkfB family radical SAM enzyme